MRPDPGRGVARRCPQACHPPRRTARRLHVVVHSAVAIGVLTVATSALAHEIPDGSEWIMADWMLLSFLSFFGSALALFVVALRRGLFRNLEQAKYYLLSVEEPDYYTPEWAREDSDASVGQR